METITITDFNQSQTFKLKIGDKRLKSIIQDVTSGTINGVTTTLTEVEVTSAFEGIKIILPIAGFWKLVGDKKCLQFFPREGVCAEFKILLV